MNAPSPLVIDPRKQAIVSMAQFWSFQLEQVIPADIHSPYKFTKWQKITFLFLKIKPGYLFYRMRDKKLGTTCLYQTSALFP